MLQTLLILRPFQDPMHAVYTPYIYDLTRAFPMATVYFNYMQKFATSLRVGFSDESDHYIYYWIPELQIKR
jgi:hypothetical protein